MIANMDGWFFLRPKNAEEEAACRSNKVAANELLVFDYGKVDEVQDLTIDIAQMSPLSLNFWMTKFVGEIGNRSVLILYKSDETQASLSLCTQCCYKCGF